MVLIQTKFLEEDKVSKVELIMNKRKRIQDNLVRHCLELCNKIVKNRINAKKRKIK